MFASELKCGEPCIMFSLNRYEADETRIEYDS